MKKLKKRSSGKKFFIFAMIVLALLISVFFIYFSLTNDDITFNVDHVFLKTVVKQGEVSNLIFRVTNLDSPNNFTIKIRGVDNIISVSESDFYLRSGEVKEISVDFTRENILPEVYVGSLILSNGIEDRIIPVIIEVQSQRPIFAVNVNVNPTYKEIEVGGETFSQVNFFNLRDKELYFADVKYDIVSLEGVVVDSETQNIVLGSESSVAKSKFLSEKLATGQYVFTVVLKSNESVSTASYLFDVIPKKFGLPFDVNVTSFFTSVVIIFLFFILILMIYIVYERNKLFGELKDQQSSELETSTKLIDKQKESSLQKVKNDKEREKILKEFNDAKEKIVNEIKAMQEHHRNEFERLHDKKKDEKLLKKKLNEWKKKGVYSTAVRKAKISNKLKKKLGALKRAYEQGYISKDSYKKGESRIKSAHEKVKK